MGACTLAVTFGFVFSLVCKGTSWSLYFVWGVEEHLLALRGTFVVGDKNMYLDISEQSKS